MGIYFAHVANLKGQESFVRVKSLEFSRRELEKKFPRSELKLLGQFGFEHLSEKEEQLVIALLGSNEIAAVISLIVQNGYRYGSGQNGGQFDPPRGINWLKRARSRLATEALQAGGR